MKQAKLKTSEQDQYNQACVYIYLYIQIDIDRQIAQILKPEKYTQIFRIPFIRNYKTI